MKEPKTRITQSSPQSFIQSVPDEGRRADALKLLKIFADATGEQPKMWGTAIVGYGQYILAKGSKTVEWPLTGFSPRKANLVLYIMPGFAEYEECLNQLGKFTTSKSCLSIKKLADVDTVVLTQLIKRSVTDMRKKYKQ